MTKSLPKPPSRPQPIVWIALILGAFILVSAVAARLTDWLWFREVGFERVFLLKIVAQWSMGALAGVVGFAVLYGNARVALRGIELVREDVRVLAQGGLEMRERFFVRLAEMLAGR